MFNKYGVKLFSIKCFHALKYHRQRIDKILCQKKPHSNFRGVMPLIDKWERVQLNDD